MYRCLLVVYDNEIFDVSSARRWVLQIIDYESKELIMADQNRKR